LPDSVARQNGIKGVIIRAVGSDTPAGKAGLKGLEAGPNGTRVGDVIVGIDDRTVSNYDDLYNELDRHNPGDHVSVKVNRDGQVVTVPVEVYVLPE
ncbi:MAG: PDZ domain-containing protein, partial [Proteobacteria bacterium]|nr:PDZ domain-containing protein [Pseudomonadota bacterium]